MTKNITKIDVGNQIKKSSDGNEPTYNFLIAAGKINQVINSEIYSDLLTLDTPDKNLVNTKLTSVKDLLRARSGFFWQKKHNSLSQIDAVSIKRKAAFTVEAESKTQTLIENSQTSDFFSKTLQKLKLIANKELFKVKPTSPPISLKKYDPEYWKVFIMGLPNIPSVETNISTKVSTSTQNTRGGISPRTGGALTASESNIDGEDLSVQFQIREETNLNISNFQAAKVLKLTNQNVEAQQQQGVTPLLNQINSGELTVTKTPQTNLSTPITSQSTTTTGVANLHTSISVNEQSLVEQASANIQESLNDIQTENVSVQQSDSTIRPAPGGIAYDSVEPTIKPNEVYVDNSFELSLPFDKKLLDIMGAPIGSLFIDTRSVYNFFINDYESILQNSELKEQLLPNMYVFCSELQNEFEDIKNSIFKQHITLSGRIPDVFVDVTNNKGEKIGEKDKGQYFEKYSMAFGELMRLAPSEELRLRRKFTNLVTPLENYDLFKDFNEKKRLFPMYWDVSFSSDNSTQFIQAFEDAQLLNVLIKDIIENNIISDEIPSQQTFLDAEQNKTKLKRTTKTEAKNFKTWNILKWIQKTTTDFTFNPENFKECVFLGKPTEQTKLFSDSQFDLYKELMLLIFVGRIKELVSKYLRNFNDLIGGKLAYSETVFYKIEKSDAFTGEIIQNFYLPNSNKIDIMRFVDTQVKYNKKYIYKVFAYQMVLGNQYRYQLDNVTDDTADVYFVNLPTLNLVEVLFHEFSGRIMDNPPIFPDVDFIPFRGVNNQILFNINSGIGEFKLDPIIIENSDNRIISLLREAQDLEEKEFLNFKSDDHASAFEIFRIDVKPKSYQDFSGNRIAIVKTDIDSITVISATAASFIDNILPNKKYYYTFRSIDNHGHISNPTAVYEVEIVDADGSVYPIIQTVEFDSIKDKITYQKSFRKYIKISPAFNQRLINEQKSGLIVDGQKIDSCKNKDNIYLGLTDEQVWDKDFKIRFTSKSTGKTIDLNFKFVYNHLKGED